MIFTLSEEQKEFYDGLRKFCKKEIEPFAEQVDESGVPTEHLQKLASIGYLGLLQDEKYGGQNTDLFTATLAQMALAEACGATFFMTGASAGLFASPVAEFGTEEQKTRILPDIIAGKKIGCLAVTEPDTGSDVAAVKTIVKSTEGSGEENSRLLLNGQKTYITNAPLADYAVILARYIKGDKDLGLTSFLVDLGKSGIMRGKPMKKLGLNGSATGELFFEDVELSNADIIGRPGRGFAITMHAFDRERLALSAYCVGVMAACLEDSLRYSKSRKAFGKTIAKHQSVAFMLADLKTKHQAAYILTLETAWLMDQAFARGEKKIEHNGEIIDISARSASTKLLASTYAREATNLAVQIHGGAGYMSEYRVSRLYRDIKIAEIGGGTSEIQKQIIARAEAKRVKL